MNTIHVMADAIARFRGFLVDGRDDELEAALEAESPAGTKGKEFLDSA